MDRQKLLLIFGGAWLSAALLSWFLYSTTSGARAAKLKPVYAAARDLAAGVRLKKGDIKQVQVPDKDAPKGALESEGQLINRALLFPVSANEVLTQTKLASLTGVEGVSSIIPEGMRAVSVSVADAASAAGLIQPRAHVDVLCTRSGSLNEAVSNIILQDVVVLSVGRVTELQLGATGEQKTGAAANVNPNSTQTRAVTLLVTPEDAAKVELAKNNGRISLALRNPSDAGKVSDPQPTTGEVIDPLMGDRRNRLTQQMRARAQATGRPGIDLRDDRAWNRLVSGEDAERLMPRAPAKKTEPPPKPRVVVDVYRGDKHVQEIFQNE